MIHLLHRHTYMAKDEVGRIRVCTGLRQRTVLHMDYETPHGTTYCLPPDRASELFAAPRWTDAVVKLREWGILPNG